MTDWLADAACRDADTAVFYPVPVQGRPRQATASVWDAPRAICNGCPVRDDCLADAIGHTEHGMRAGLTPDELKTWHRCTICGTVFRHPSHQAKLCSDACRREQHRRQSSAHMARLRAENARQWACDRCGLDFGTNHAAYHGHTASRSVWGCVA